MSQFLVFTLMSFLALTALSSELDSVQYLGVGYNLLYGNPDGDLYDSSDSGINFDRRIFEFSYEEGKLTDDNLYYVPDEVIASNGESCSSVTSVFYSPSSYQEKLNKDVGIDGSSEHCGLLGYQFMMSDRMSLVETQTVQDRRVLKEYRNVCNKGTARYQSELADIDSYKLNIEFVNDVCALPARYAETQYVDFIDKWGTDVIVEVDVGQKTLERYSASQTDIVHCALSSIIKNATTHGGPYNGYSSSVRVNMDNYDVDLCPSEKWELEENIVLGAESNAEPISLKLLCISSVFENVYWSSFDEYVINGTCRSGDISDLESKRANIKDALAVYPALKSANKAPVTTVEIPVTWPFGTYTIPMTDTTPNGCPAAHFYWKIGSRFHDTENSLSSNDWSDPLHLIGPYKRNNMQQNFCSKGVEEEDSYNWKFEAGQYCIFKKGVACPSGFDEGWMFWNDEDTLNSNSVNGELPEGVYNKDTKIYYCSRNDGFASNPITLPTDDPFFLLKSSHMCQEVYGMNVAEEWFHWDNDGEWFNSDYYDGSYPYNTGRGEDFTLHYCYYKKQ
ncbi:uncharacterized protein [Antedon mediterranea]|uniref:uncharacterized protein n=1 Tax=Antedon mediterranea TaxID=105859 RepID=UPI003AF508E2